MFEGLNESHLPAAIEALLFVTDEPLKVDKMASALGTSKEAVQEALSVLAQEFNSEMHGIVLKEIAGGWRLFTKETYAPLLEKYVLSWDTRKLSAAAMETLAVIAYLQPVTRGAIASIRGVNSDSTISTLIEKGLVREAGVADAPGNPILYATTRNFLEKFGLASTRELPNLDDFAPDEQTRLLIRERLNAQTNVLPPEVVEAIARGDELPAEERAMYEERIARGNREDGETAVAEAVCEGGEVHGEGAAQAACEGSEACGEAAAQAASESSDTCEDGEAHENLSANQGDGDAQNASGSNTAKAKAVSEAENTAASLFQNSIPAELSEEMRDELLRASASVFGLVDKIDFDSLVFDTDDE